MKLFLCVSLLFFYLVSALPTARQSEPTKGSITEPSAGTVIMPGTPFDFQYKTRADYSCTSFNFTVLLLTSLPSSFGPTDLFSTGHLFGRFAEPNYPGMAGCLFLELHGMSCSGNPYPPNTVPSQLVMPDFSKSPGGWGVGVPASNTTMYIVVLEEFADGASVGIKLSLAVTPVVYNGTAV